LHFAELSVIDVAFMVLRQAVEVAKSERTLAVCPQQPNFLITAEAARLILLNERLEYLLGLAGLFGLRLDFFDGRLHLLWLDSSILLLVAPD